jgi:DNA-binding transcriptional ArsR family regulator
MTQISPTGNEQSTAELTDGDWYQLLAARKRRLVLEILSNRSQPISVADLATQVAAAETDQPLMNITREETMEVQTALRHVHLPQLAEEGLVTESDGAVNTAKQSELQNPRIQTILTTEADDWDAVLDCLANDHQRILLRVLSENGEPMDRSALAAELSDAVKRDGHARLTTEDIDVRLHHQYLPKLTEAGLIRYDRSEGLVRYDGHPSLPDEYLYASVTHNPESILSVATKSSDIWRITDRENVVAQGQSLFDEADDELFLMITTDGLLEERCIQKLQAAIDRGVDVFVGSQTTGVRDLVRERLPEAVIWEPQMDWMNLPPNHEKVGRLLFADREKIMVGTLGEEGPDGVPMESALVGVGQNNPLVMLLRELLGSRLDHLDQQSADFRSQIPL